MSGEASSSLFPPDRADLIRGGRKEGIRYVLEPGAWAALATGAPHRGPALPLLGMWAEAAGFVHALFHEARSRPLIASVPVEAGRYHGLSERMPGASPYERIIRDLWGFEAMHARDLRPLLDHGAWTASSPCAARPGPPPRGPEPPEWHAAPEADIALVERGPIGGDVALLRSRATIAGDRVRRLELQHGYGHRGIAQRAIGLTPEAAIALAERASARSMVAHGLAFARAVEQASSTTPPPRAVGLREIALECERMTAYLRVLARAARAAGALRLLGVASNLIDAIGGAASACFGHFLLGGVVVPGGVAVDPAGDELGALAAASRSVEAALPRLATLYGSGLAPLLDGLAIVDVASAGGVAASGIVGRASGQSFDARRLNRLPETIPAEAPVDERGCAEARMRLRIAGIGHAAARIDRLIEALPPGAVAQSPGQARGEGAGVAEGPEGDIWHVLRLDAEGQVAGLFIRDPALGHASLAETASAGIALEKLPLALISFGLSTAAMDL